jgi:hypothetical protein
MKNLPKFKFNIWSICIYVLVLLFVAGLNTAQAGKGGKKGSAGGAGFGESAVRAFYLDGLYSHGIVSDKDTAPYPEYCHGFDGQVTVFSQFLHILKAHNQNERWLAVDPVCHEPEELQGTCIGGTRFYIDHFSTYRRAELDGATWQGDPSAVLALRDMNSGEIARATMYIDLGKKRQLLFGNTNFFDSSGNCGKYNPDRNEPLGDDETRSAPVWVRCENVLELEGEYHCVHWTISTFDLRDSSEPDFPDDAAGCLIKWQKGQAVVESADVEADFQVDVQDVPSGDTSCPQQ